MGLLPYIAFGHISGGYYRCQSCSNSTVACLNSFVRSSTCSFISFHSFFYHSSTSNAIVNVVPFSLMISNRPRNCSSTRIFTRCSPRVFVVLKSNHSGSPTPSSLTVRRTAPFSAVERLTSILPSALFTKACLNAFDSSSFTTNPKGTAIEIGSVQSAT